VQAWTCCDAGDERNHIHHGEIFRELPCRFTERASMKERLRVEHATIVRANVKAWERSHRSFEEIGECENQVASCEAACWSKLNIIPIIFRSCNPDKWTWDIFPIKEDEPWALELDERRKECVFWRPQSIPLRT
jgi:hypothetical protein